MSASQGQNGSASGHTLNTMNGAKKKSNAHLITGTGGTSNMNSGTLGASTHGYGPISTGLNGLISGVGPSLNSNVQAMPSLGMNINVYKQGSATNNTQSNIKDSLSFSKINAKIKKRQLNGANMTGL